jgi:hypothetical protein
MLLRFPWDDAIVDAERHDGLSSGLRYGSHIYSSHWSLQSFWSLQENAELVPHIRQRPRVLWAILRCCRKRNIDWPMNWKWFGTKRSWLNRCTIPVFVSRNWGKPRNVSQDNRCRGRDTTLGGYVTSVRVWLGVYEQLNAERSSPTKHREYPDYC